MIRRHSAANLRQRLQESLCNSAFLTELTSVLRLLPILLGTEIPLHNGEYKGLLSYHLGLEIPESGGPSTYVEPMQFSETMWHTGCPLEQTEILDRTASGKEYFSQDPSTVEVCRLPPTHLGIAEYRKGSNALNGGRVKGADIIDFSHHVLSNGSDILFDDNYYHYAQNYGSDGRTILWCQVQRHDLYHLANILNSVVIYYIYPLIPEIHEELRGEGLAGLNLTGCDECMVPWFLGGGLTGAWHKSKIIGRLPRLEQEPVTGHVYIHVMGILCILVTIVGLCMCCFYTLEGSCSCRGGRGKTKKDHIE